MARRIHRSASDETAVESPQAMLKRRASRLARKGEHRKAALVLRDLVTRHESAAAWVLLGSMLRLARRDDEAVAAWRQGLWLHRRDGAERRVRTVARLIHSLDPGDAKIARLAA